MGNYDQYYEARDILTEVLKKDLVGPVNENERLSVSPSKYYAMGKLYPHDQEQSHSAVENEALGISMVMENDAVQSEDTVSRANHVYPSSFALTFQITDKVHVLQVEARWAKYVRIPAAEVSDEITAPKYVWQREPFSSKLSIPVTEPGNFPYRLSDGVRLEALIRSGSDGDGSIVTVSLINEAKSTKGDRSADVANTLFQPIVEVRTDATAGFKELRVSPLRKTAEGRDMELLYSGTSAYANGHGCSVEWDSSAEGPEWIRSCFMPHMDVQQMQPAGKPSPALSMLYLMSASDEEIDRDLNKFVHGYTEWIKQLRDRAEAVDESLRSAAAKHIDLCNRTADRMKAGIQALKDDCVAMRAFRLMNEALLLQRQNICLRERTAFEPAEVKWYPFQLAFILHELTSFVNPEYSSDGQHFDREIVDLLWFPTGGGKTEAYLGISAFAIFLRRLRDPDDAGVTVIMRYTMRLLTLQQFERASMMICACEHLRKKHRLGGLPISIGLWVGESLAPNKLKDARAALNRKPSERHDTGDPVQISSCPWCSTHLDRQNYTVDEKASRMQVHCPNPKCEFYGSEDGLPIHVIDEDVYHHQPTFLIATIDKFAQMPLKEECGSLFGVGSIHNPPDLIIQDELHLIAGQLGTIAGLYEAAVTRACRREDDVGVKVIASTATVRGAEKQMRALYGKESAQFPPPGLSFDDMYFASPADSDSRPTRRYLGVMGVGLSTSETLIRIYGALLFGTRYLAEIGYSDEVVDSFWTITGYFNTIRELGESATQLTEEVQARFQYLASTKFKDTYPGVDPSNAYDYLTELTSRADSYRIKHILQDGLTRQYKSDSADNDDVYDFVIATNMISVGVDIGRLGTMIVAGQPKMHAEYIQATSRVGRSNPGLVICAYYPYRSRDRSHYEQFWLYHGSMYRHVEPASLTPFSDRSRDRALHALFITLCRYMDSSLRPNSGAKEFSRNLTSVQSVISFIEEYAARVDPSEQDGLHEDLEEIVRIWDTRASDAREHGKQLVYIDYRNPGISLLNVQDRHGRFFTMSSMRTVEPEVSIYLKERGGNNA